MPPRTYTCDPCRLSFTDGLPGYLNHRHLEHGDQDALHDLLDLSIRVHDGLMRDYDDLHILREAEHGIRLTEQFLRHHK